nr:MAG TPA: hypothetical protein [Caudoviricetes sp.]
MTLLQVDICRTHTFLTYGRGSYRRKKYVCIYQSRCECRASR